LDAGIFFVSPHARGDVTSIHIFLLHQHDGIVMLVSDNAMFVLSFLFFIDVMVGPMLGYFTRDCYGTGLLRGYHPSFFPKNIMTLGFKSRLTDRLSFPLPARMNLV
jgi:hypothetical protein